MRSPKLLSFLLRIFSFFIAVQASFSLNAQSLNGTLHGTVVDATTLLPIAGVVIMKEPGGKSVVSDGSGAYMLPLSEGKHSLRFQIDGFQSKVVRGVIIYDHQTTEQRVMLRPLIKGEGISRDSIAASDSLAQIPSDKEAVSIDHRIAALAKRQADVINHTDQRFGGELSAAQLTQRLGSVSVGEAALYPGLQTVSVMTLDDRYTQVIVDGLPWNSADAHVAAFPLSAVSAQQIASVNVATDRTPELPGSTTGGAVSFSLTDMPDRNDFFVRAGVSATDQTTGKTFLGDEHHTVENFGLIPSSRKLPGGFPTTRSAYTLNQKNPQEQVYLAKLLPNNLAPQNFGNAWPGERFEAGWSHLYRLKHNKRLGITAFAAQQTDFTIFESAVQSAPDVASHPYPFDNSSANIIRFRTDDQNYRRTASGSASLTACLAYGKNKITFRGFFTSQFANTYTGRKNVFKPDEDSIAHSGLLIVPVQRSYVGGQLSGTHMPAASGRLQLNWQFRYSATHVQSPDQRSFLLRQDSTDANIFEIAHPTTTSYAADPSNPDKFDARLLNTSRRWQEYTDQDFGGTFRLQTSFNAWNHPQLLSGGISIQSLTRTFHSDLLLISGPGYYSLADLIAPERYFPGGLTATSYHVNNQGGRNVYANQLGNYTGSVNTGASFLRWQMQPVARLHIDLGIRAEMNSQLVSNTQYNYLVGFKNPQLTNIDENLYTSQPQVLPSVKATFELLPSLTLYASYFRSINRPLIQELTKYADYNPFTGIVSVGNPYLRNARIDNVEAGTVFLPSGRTSISVKGFYKYFTDPIEPVVTAFSAGTRAIIPNNAPPATVYGANAHAQVTIGRKDFRRALALTMVADGTVSHSNVDQGPLRSLRTPSVKQHTLAGSPEYFVNGGALLNVGRSLELGLWYSIKSDFLYAVGSGKSYGTYLAIPDYRMKSRQQLDSRFLVTSRNQRFQAGLNLLNLLAEDVIVYQDLNGSGKFEQAFSLKDNSGQLAGGVDNTVWKCATRRSYQLSLYYSFN